MLLPNIPTKTLGGHVFWNTLNTKNGWKLQKNIFTDHYRVLDPDDVRWAWGLDEAEIRAAFRTLTESKS
jgi:hypothetical protein